MRGENTSCLTLKAKLHIGTFSVTNLLFRFVLKMSVTYNIADRIQDGAAIPHYVTQCIQYKHLTSLHFVPCFGLNYF